MAVHEASADLILTVRLDECISACAQDTEATCDAQLDGEEIVVRSGGHWSDSNETCIAVRASLDAPVLHVQRRFVRVDVRVTSGEFEKSIVDRNEPFCAAVKHGALR